MCIKELKQFLEHQNEHGHTKCERSDHISSNILYSRKICWFLKASRMLGFIDSHARQLGPRLAAKALGISYVPYFISLDDIKPSVSLTQHSSLDFPMSFVLRTPILLFQCPPLPTSKQHFFSHRAT